MYEVWNEAHDIWPSSSLEDKIKCLVSIETGVPSLKPFKDDLIGIGQSLLAIATETEKTAERYSRAKSVNWLRNKKKGKWVLILDNVDNTDFLLTLRARDRRRRKAA